MLFRSDNLRRLHCSAIHFFILNNKTNYLEERVVKVFASNSTKKFALSAVAAAMFTPTLVSAQESSSESGGFILDEIIVTAQKREQSLQEVPLAVTVLREDQIDSSFGENIEALQALVPSVSFRTGNTTRNSALTVRGIGTISFSIGAERYD